MINSNLQRYIKTEILPRYEKMPGHTGNHIQQVIERSFYFVTQLTYEVNLDMVYTTAAYHDLGREFGDKYHHLASGKIVREDTNLRIWFSEEEITTIAQAVEDHRASNIYEPRSIYGRIVSSADRNTDVFDMLERVYDHTKFQHPESTDDEVIEIARKHLQDKYSLNGYASTKMYFKDLPFQDCLACISRITEDPDIFKNILISYNHHRFSKGE